MRNRRFAAGRIVAVAALALSLAPLGAAGQDMETPTVQAGQPAPDFELQDAHGATHRLSELTQTGPVVLEFFRSGGW